MEENIDFEQNTITIRHTVTSCDLDGKRVLVASDTTKTKSSMRTLPLVPFMRERLLALKEEQQENRRLCGRSYIKDYIGYVCVNEIGDLIKPHYVTESFPKLLKANGLRHIRYHDLRHKYDLMIEDLLTMAELLGMVADMRTKDVRVIQEFGKYVPAFAAFEKNRLSLYREAAKEAEDILTRWEDEIDEDDEPDEYFSD